LEHVDLEASVFGTCRPGGLNRILSFRTSYQCFHQY